MEDALGQAKDTARRVAFDALPKKSQTKEIIKLTKGITTAEKAVDAARARVGLAEAARRAKGQRIQSSGESAARAKLSSAHARVDAARRELSLLTK